MRLPFGNFCHRCRSAVSLLGVEIGYLAPQFFVSLTEQPFVDIKDTALYIKLSGWFSSVRVVVLLVCNPCADQFPTLCWFWPNLVNIGTVLTRGITISRYAYSSELWTWIWIIVYTSSDLIWANFYLGLEERKSDCDWKLNSKSGLILSFIESVCIINYLLVVIINENLIEQKIINALQTKSLLPPTNS